ncbi:MAG: NAD(P)H-dependent oxidoreductase [Thermoleophilia bacterium]|nr:NAD(P)H-dependent oxidoreductase [Thermoleophilia bacterium]
MTNSLTIGVILGSTRPGRNGEAVANWVMDHTSGRSATYELVDLATYNLPLLCEPTVPGAANRQYEREETRAWGSTIDRFDGFVFVTPEYNHGVPGALKNAFDVIYPEWSQKALGLVAYGADGGVRAVEQWRTIAANAMLYAVRAQVALSLFQDWGQDGFAPIDRRPGELGTVLDQVEQLAGALKPLRG